MLPYLLKMLTKVKDSYTPHVLSVANKAGLGILLVPDALLKCNDHDFGFLKASLKLSGFGQLNLGDF